MKINIYSLKDENVGFGQLMLQDNDAVAMRSMLNAYMVNNSIYQTAPGDFTLYCLGSFDTDTAVISPLPSPSKVVCCSDFMHLDARKDV